MRSNNKKGRCALINTNEKVTVGLTDLPEDMVDIDNSKSIGGRKLRIHSSMNPLAYRTVVLALSLTGFLFAGSCDKRLSSGPAASDPVLTVTLQSSSIEVSKNIPVTLTVTIVNNSPDRLQWGVGSSSCRLWAYVLKDGREYLMSVHSVCTDDLMPYYLDPGEQDAQSIRWNGRAWVETWVDLSPGEYEVVGAAGDYRSKPIMLSVVSD